MTNSRSNPSRNELLVVLVVVCAAVLGVGGGVARAERKRVVVLDFEGPKGERFHDDLVKLIKKTHTVVPTDKWNGTAEELGAGGASDRNIKKVAKKLKVDAVVEGKIEKRRDEFIIRLRLHAGKTGELIGNPIDTKAEGPRLDGRAQRDLKDELFAAIDNVESNRLGGSDDDGDARSAKKPSKKAEDDDDDRLPPKTPARKTADDDDEDKPVKKAFSKRADDERGTDKVDRKPTRKAAAEADDDDALPAKKPAKKLVAADDDALPAKKPPAKKLDDDDKAGKKLKKLDDDKPAARKPVKKLDDAPVARARTDGEDPLPKKPVRTASRDDGDDGDKKPAAKKLAARDDDGAEVDAEVGEPVAGDAALAPGERALDAVAGLSFTARRLSFTSRAGLTNPPPAYKGTPVAGAMLDATFYPLALGHKRRDMGKNLGVEVMYDRVLTINSKNAAGATFATSESRYGIGVVFRYAFHKTAMAPVVLGTLGYSSQSFTISNSNMVTADIPSVKYSIIAPGAGLRYPVTPKLLASVDLKLLAITSAGPIQDPMQYGSASVLGFEGAIGADYLITRNIFARAAFRFETIGLGFQGNGTMATSRDGQPTTLDVTGARDSYIGGLVTAGYLY